MNKKLIAIIVALVIVTAGIGLYAMKGSGCLETVEELDLVQITKQCIEDPKAASQVTSDYVSKRVKIEGSFKRLSFVSQSEANRIGLEGKNLHSLGLIYETKVQHKEVFSSKTADTPVLIACYLAEGQEKKVQGRKKEGDPVTIIGTVLDVSRDAWAGSYIAIVLKDCKIVK